MSITMEHVNAATRENEYITTLPSVMNKLITDEKDTLNKLNKIRGQLRDIISEIANAPNKTERNNNIIAKYKVHEGIIEQRRRSYLYIGHFCVYARSQLIVTKGHQVWNTGGVRIPIPTSFVLHHSHLDRLRQHWFGCKNCTPKDHPRKNSETPVTLCACAAYCPSSKTECLPHVGEVNPNPLPIGRTCRSGRPVLSIFAHLQKHLNHAE